MISLPTSPFTLEQNSHFNLAHGFLPQHGPLTILPRKFSAWEEAIVHLPKLLAGQQVKKILEILPDFDYSALETPEEFERAMLLLSYFGHAYVWGGSQPATSLPAKLAIPWQAVACKIGRPPVLSYASYALYNWQRFDKNKPVQLGNIALLQNFLGGIDEEWFILIHVDIEYKAIPALVAAQCLSEILPLGEPDAVVTQLNTISLSLEDMCTTLDRMPEHCDPYIYYNRVRPYIHGWKDNPALPNGLLYEGVTAYHHQPQFFKGETGAQSSIIPALDAVLGIGHENNPLKAHLDEMRFYMPPQHQQFLQTLEKKSRLRNYILQNDTASGTLRDLYNQCVHRVARFRNTHLHYAATYIQKQQQTSVANANSVGTGGTPFMEYLRKHKQETEKYLL